MNTSNEQRPTMERSGANQKIQFGGFNGKNHKRYEALPQYLVDELLSCLPSRANQARRFVEHVAKNPNATTAQCNVAALAVNLSDIAVKYNPYLESKGYKLVCCLPCKLIRNRLGEQTMQHQWWLMELPELGGYGE